VAGKVRDDSGAEVARILAETAYARKQGDMARNQ